MPLHKGKRHLRFSVPLFSELLSLFPPTRKPSFARSALIAFSVMFKSVTVRAKDLNVLWKVIFSIPVLVMNCKNFGMFHIFASLAFFDEASSLHPLSGWRHVSRIGYFSSTEHSFACHTAARIFNVPYPPRGGVENGAAISAFRLYRSFLRLGLSVTRSGAIFGRAAPRTDVLKFLVANSTIGHSSNSISETFASVGAVFAAWGFPSLPCVVPAALLAFQYEHGGVYASR